MKILGFSPLLSESHVSLQNISGTLLRASGCYAKLSTSWLCGCISTPMLAWSPLARSSPDQAIDHDGGRIRGPLPITVWPCVDVSPSLPLGFRPPSFSDLASDVIRGGLVDSALLQETTACRMQVVVVRRFVVTCRRGSRP